MRDPSGMADKTAEVANPNGNVPGAKIPIAIFPLDRWDVGALVAVLVVYLLLTFITFNQIDEDAYIYFRAAANIAEGFGYVFNRGEVPTEVGSANNWMFLLVLLSLLPFDITISAKLLGAFCGVLTLSAVYMLSRRIISDRRLAFFPPLLTAFNVPVLSWYQRGLETPLYSLTVILLVLVSISAVTIHYWPVLAAVFFTGRPESAAMLAGLVPSWYLAGVNIRNILKPAAVVATIAVIIELIRLGYFHDFLPQPFYRKIGAVGGMRGEGIEGIYTFLQCNNLQFLAWPALLGLIYRRFWSPPVIVVTIYAALLVIWAAIPMEAKPFERHAVPAIPLVYILLIHGLIEAYPQSWRARRTVCMTYAAIILIGTSAFAKATQPWFGDLGESPLVVASKAFAKEPVTYSKAVVSKARNPYKSNPTVDLSIALMGTNYQALTGQFIERTYPKGIKVIYDQMGQTPYFAGMDKAFFDSFGLTEKSTGYHIFLNRKDLGIVVRTYRKLFERVIENGLGKEMVHRSEEELLDHLFGMEPEVIMINTFVTLHLPNSPTSMIARDPRLERDYEHAYQVETVVSIYERKGAIPPITNLDPPEGLNVVDVRTGTVFNP